MKRRYIISFVIAFILLMALFLWNVAAGSVDISTSDLFAIFAGSGKDETFSQIVWKIRLPRILAAILLGGALSVSGFLLQSFFQNPIAGPYVLGISSGAKLVVALTMIFLLEKGIMISSFGMVAAAFVGSMLAMGFVLLISFRVSKMSLLVVCGIMIGYICSAITDFCVTFASDSNIVNLHNWSMGSFSGMISRKHPVDIGIVRCPEAFSDVHGTVVDRRDYQNLIIVHNGALLLQIDQGVQQIAAAVLQGGLGLTIGYGGLFPQALHLLQRDLHDNSSFRAGMGGTLRSRSCSGYHTGLEPYFTIS